jgi:hypothetical protein
MLFLNRKRERKARSLAKNVRPPEREKGQVDNDDEEVRRGSIALGYHLSVVSLLQQHRPTQHSHGAARGRGPDEERRRSLSFLRVRSASATTAESQRIEHDDESNLESLPQSPLHLSDGDRGGYGFAHMFRDVLHHDWSRDGIAKEMLEGWLHFWCDWPSSSTRAGDEFAPALRQRLRMKRRQVENDNFSSDRYLQDTDVEDDYFVRIPVCHGV